MPQDGTFTYELSGSHELIREGSSPPKKHSSISGRLQCSLYVPSPRSPILICNNHSEVGPEGDNESWLEPNAFRAPEVLTGACRNIM